MRKVLPKCVVLIERSALCVRVCKMGFVGTQGLNKYIHLFIRHVSNS